MGKILPICYGATVTGLLATIIGMPVRGLVTVKPLNEIQDMVSGIEKFIDDPNKQVVHLPKAIQLSREVFDLNKDGTLSNEELRYGRSVANNIRTGDIDEGFSTMYRNVI